MGRVVPSVGVVVTSQKQQKWWLEMNVVSIRGQENHAQEVDWRRELALQIALQLPRKAADAFIVLKAAEDAYLRFLLPGGPL